MKAVVSADAPGVEDTRVVDLPDPVAGPGEVLIAVRACGVNYPDVLLLQDRYQLRPPRPFSPGGEVAGVGAGVTEFAAGARRRGRRRPGGRPGRQGPGRHRLRRRGLSALFKEHCPGGAADVVFDQVGGDYTEAALRAMAPDGRLLVVGFPAGIPGCPPTWCC